MFLGQNPEGLGLRIDTFFFCCCYKGERCFGQRKWNANQGIQDLGIQEDEYLDAAKEILGPW